MTKYFKTKPWRLIILLAFFVTGCLKAVPGQAEYGEKIRVLISKGASELELKSTHRGNLRVKKTGSASALVNGKEKALPMRLFPEEDYIYVNGRPYRGIIEVSGGREGLLVVNEINMENYLAGIINNEISSKWPEDVIKTQAVIARTYALFNRARRLKSPYHVDSSVMGQVYSGAASEDQASLKAVKDTAGEVLMFGGEPALTVYHSNAGGKTDSAKAIWLRDYPYLVPVDSPFDSTAPKFQWEYMLPADALRDMLSSSGQKIGVPESIEILSTTPAGRVTSLLIKDGVGGEARLSGEDLRKIAGYSSLRSTIFEVGKDGSAFVFKGKGSGHGVGLSQWGAKCMAEQGYSYKEILNHFYPGTELVKTY